MEQDLEEAKRGLFRNISRKIDSEAVVDAMRHVPREEFVPLPVRHMSYLDIPLAIGEGQTISQPYIVAMMTAALEVQ